MERFAWFWQDFQYGLRGMRRDRAFSVISVLALALGIGATTVMYSVVEAVLLRPFPYANADRLTSVYIQAADAPPDDFGRPVFTGAEFHEITEQNHVFEEVIGISAIDVLRTDNEGAQQFRGAQLTPNAFPMLGMAPLRGRVFGEADARPGAPPVAVISHKVWQSHFGGDPKVIGSVVTLNEEKHTVIGIMPPRFMFWAADFWLPLNVQRTSTNLAEQAVWLLGKRKPDVSIEAMGADIEVIARRLARQYSHDYPPKFIVRIRSLMDGVVGRFKGIIYMLMGAVTLLLLIACSNVANLLLARATVREREIAIRASMGASRGRLVRQLLVESFALASAASLLGCVLAYGGLKGVAAAIPTDTIPIEAQLRLSPVVLLFALAVTVGTTILCGLAPALHAIRGELAQRLQSSGKGSGGTFTHGTFRSAFVVTEIALSIVLLVGAGLMMRSLLALRNVAIGISTDHVLVARLPLPKGRYETADSKRRVYRQIVDRLSALPGVKSAAVTISLPPYGGPESELTIAGLPSGENRRAQFQLVSEGYFQTLGHRLLRGRLLSESDVELGRRVALVNQTMVTKYFPSEGPIGRSIKFAMFDRVPESPRDAYFEIVGVISDAKNRGITEPVTPEAYLPHSVAGFGQRGVLVRTAVQPESLLNSVRREVWAVDRDIALTNTGSIDGFLRQFSYAQPQFGLILMTVFAVIGTTLVAIGIFSVMTYTVSLQTREIGIRMALGAQHSSVLNMILRRGLTLIGVGIALGVVAGAVLTRVMSHYFWGVSTSDPPTFIGGVCLLLLVGLTACAFPARRAIKVDPMIALRYE
jgi:putative ABC transport system permease protein